jgi:hypothetical protein
MRPTHRCLIPVVVIASGCAAGPAGQLGTGLPGSVSGPEVRIEDAPPSVLAFPGASADDLWKVLPVTFQALDIPAGIMDPGARVYGSEKVTEATVAARSTRDLFRCGADAGLSPSQYRVQFGITAQPRRTPSGGAELIVQTAAFGRLVSASRSGTTHCVSNGSLELKIKEQVDIELARIRM